MKWEAVAAEPGPRYVVVNADEGEPGTIKDRYVMELRPHLMLEGMLIAMRFAEATEGFIYLREEYGTARERLGNSHEEVDPVFRGGSRDDRSHSTLGAFCRRLRASHRERGILRRHLRAVGQLLDARIDEVDVRPDVAVVRGDPILPVADRPDVIVVLALQ